MNRHYRALLLNFSTKVDTAIAYKKFARRRTEK